MNIKWRLHDIRIFFKYLLKDLVVEFISLIKSVFRYIVNFRTIWSKMMKPTNLMLFFLVWMLVFILFTQYYLLAIFLYVCGASIQLMKQYQSGEHRFREGVKEKIRLVSKYKNH